MFNTNQFCLLLLVVFFESNAELLHPLRESERKCFVPELPTKFLRVGITVTVPGKCIQVRCNSDFTITGLTCPQYASASMHGCRMSNINYYKDYPDCCPQFVCNSF